MFLNRHSIYKVLCNRCRIYKVKVLCMRIRVKNVPLHVQGANM